MSETRTSTEEILVHFLRPGPSPAIIISPMGRPSATSCHLAGISTANQAIFVDGVPPEEALPLHDGAVVTIVPRPRSGAGEEPWHASVPAFVTRTSLASTLRR